MQRARVPRNEAVNRQEREVRNQNPGASERLCYFLRHHASKDRVFAAKGVPGGWFKFSDVLPWFRNLSEEQLEGLIESSRSFIPPHAHRFEARTEDGEKWVRARYGHSFDTNFSDVEREPAIGEVLTLTELLIKNIILSMPTYLPHLNDIQDGNIISALFDKYKKVPGVTMSNKIIKQFLLPQVAVLDFKGVLLEESIIRLLPKLVPSLFSLSLEGCFTCMTDTNLQYLLKRCTELRQLDISGCKYITQLGLQHIIKHGSKLSLLSVRWLKCVNSKWITAICAALPDLSHLILTGCPCIHPSDAESLQDAAPHIFIQYDTVDDVPHTEDDVDQVAEDAQAHDHFAEAEDAEELDD